MYIRKRGQFYHYEFFVNGSGMPGVSTERTAPKPPLTKRKHANSRTRSVARFSMALSAMKWSGNN